MYKKIFLLLFFLASVQLWSQEKARFDVVPRPLAKGQTTETTDGVETTTSTEIKNDKFDMTLLPGGYFTLGTNNGASDSKLDNNCQITFGHPFAKTSYPLFSIDGVWYKPDEFFTSSQDFTVTKNSDTLKITAVKPGVVSISYTLFFSPQDQTVKFKQSIINLDSKAHNLGLAFVFDPALGKLGDGNLELNGGFLKESKILKSTDIPAIFSMWEKTTGAKGIGIDISFDKQPGSVTAGNWNDFYDKQSPESIILTQTIYDLLLKFYWPESSITQGSEKTVTATVSLKTPDFSKGIFLRWDLPQSITIDNNIVFPQNISSYIQINKSGSASYSAASLKIETPEEITSDQAQISYSSAIPDFQRVNLSPQIVYDESAPEIIVKFMSGTEIIDEMHRLVHIPATPLSDTGLVVKIDSLVTTKLPTVSLEFETAIKRLGNKITNLQKGNIFLYENNERIKDYSFTKDTAGGVQAADIIFALDVTGSMSEEIAGVKKNIIEFSDSLAKQGIDYQLGMVTFLDVIENIYPFTKDVQLFQQNVAAQSAHGGGDTPENSLQALLETTRFNFRNNAKRIVIWITDADYHEQDSYTTLVKKVVIDSLLIKGITVDAIGAQGYKSGFYDPITLATGGNYYDINGNFRDILLDISRMKSSYKYWLSYKSAATTQGVRAIKLKINYAGFGGQADTNYTTVTLSAPEKRFAFYPNPFNPEITFKVNKGNYNSARIKIFNLLGQQVKEFNIDGNNLQNVVWNARNESGSILSSGIYFVTLTLSAPDKKNYTETAKILYLK